MLHALFHYLLAENSSLIISYPSQHHSSGYFVFHTQVSFPISFIFIFSSSCLPRSQNNHMICHQNCHFLSRVKPMCRGRNKLCHRTWEKPLGCSGWGCCRMQQNTIIKWDEMRLAATLSGQLPGLRLRQAELGLWQSSHIWLACY